MVQELHVVLTGPIRGTVTTHDGHEIDVRPEQVIVESAERAAEIAHLVGQRYATEGHPDVPGDFTYNTPGEAALILAEDPDHPLTRAEAEAIADADPYTEFTLDTKED